MKICFTPNAWIFRTKIVQQISPILIFLFISVQSNARTFFVTNSGDSGTGSLRYAVELAANSPGQDVVEFAIGSGIQYLELAQPLFIPSGVFIDGMSQPGYSGLPLIHFIGSGYLRIENVEQVVIESLDLSETSAPYAIRMNSVENCSVFHSNLSQHQYGIYMETGSVDCHFVGNRFYGCAFGLYTTGFHQGMIITDNDFASISKSSISSTEKLHIIVGENNFHQSVPLSEKIIAVTYNKEELNTTSGLPLVRCYTINSCSIILVKNGKAGDLRIDVSGKNTDEVEYLLVHPSGRVIEHGRMLANQKEEGKIHVNSEGYKLFVKNKGKVIVIDIE